MKRLFGQLALALFSTLLCLIALEFGLRLYSYGSIARLSGEHSLRGPDPVRGWKLLPDEVAFQRTADYSVQVAVNSLGLRDVEHAYEPAPGVFRIVVLGDSYMEAYQVPLEQSLPRLLEAALAGRSVEVINLGVGGYGTTQEFLALRDEGLRYQPDLVLLAFYPGNDILNNSRPLQRALIGDGELKVFGRPYAHADDLSGPLRIELPDAEAVSDYMHAKAQKRAGSGFSRLVRPLEPTLLFNRIERAIAALRERVPRQGAHDPHVVFGWPFLVDYSEEAARDLAREEYDAYWSEAWRVTRRVLLEADRLSAEHGARFAVFTVPSDFQVQAGAMDLLESRYAPLRFDADKMERELAAFTADAEIPLLALTPAFRREAEANRVLFHLIEDRHWNAAGHELATAELVGFLERESLLR